MEMEIKKAILLMTTAVVTHNNNMNNMGIVSIKKIE
jgi:hypothetical protein